MTGTDIRRFKVTDAAPAAHLFFDAVRRGTTAFYDAAQRRAWAPNVPNTASWRDRLASQMTFVAEQDGKLVGFMTLNSQGYIDLAFVAPTHIGTGVAGALYQAIERRASELSITHLKTEASHQARRFFLRNGWVAVQEQTVKRAGVTLTNFVMEKRLG